ncbi:hypothetical protein GCM10007216_03800 [Thalassobacillus devorans]|uniref:Uncharacterized protein n=1 Tax=Thalassobacillus devorans TaxID=279813 RepID=A0ABQ1NJB0_9BACI|nr:hypothetical protein [Thalassobacillus devorans]NIK27288.1 hypothetical protein [Thalassobacillus devorans]GGC76484.1 hypothetical protein GCM10007216_03800 [Thalassobacillus devorans]
MANKKLSLSKEGKDLLEQAVVSLDLERALVIKMALAKGLSYKDDFEFDTSSSPKWTIPDIIKNNEYLMFKHLIISKSKQPLEDEYVQSQMQYYIEKGIRVIGQELDNKNSLEDSRFVII